MKKIIAMTIMKEDILISINTIIFSILYIITLVITTYIILTKLFPYLDKKNEIKDKEVKNKKYELFKDIDTDIIKQTLDAYFEGYVNRYITYKFLSKKEMYIKSEEAEKMVNDITKLICIQIYELYVFYITMLYSISDDEDLVQYIHNKVENTCIEAITNYNSSMTA